MAASASARRIRSASASVYSAGDDDDGDDERCVGARWSVEAGRGRDPNAGCGGAAACGQKSLVEYVRGPEVRDGAS